MKGNIDTVPSIKEKEDAQTHINLMIQECNIMGTNDFEIPALRGLLEKLNKDEISPEEATKEATSIRYGKQEYR